MPILGIDGDRFNINDEPCFLVFISYFDALRTSDATLDTDFAELRTAGIDGIRIFPNWWLWSDMTRFPDDTLVDPYGDLRPDRLAKLKAVLEKAAAHNLVVDVSFAYEMVPGITAITPAQLAARQSPARNQVNAEKYERALTQVAEALLPYRHLFIDIQNECNGGITHLSDDELRRLAAAIKRVDPARIVTASMAYEIGPEDCAQRSERLGFDLIAWHESRNPWQYDAMEDLVRRCKSITSKPVYLGEPPSMKDDFTPENFLAALTKAKAAGAAAWTFHTQHGFDLSRIPLREQLSGREKEFLRYLTVRRAEDSHAP